MKRSLTIAAAAATIALSTTSCASGPDRLGRSWDGWTNQKYADDSLIHGALLQDIVPVYTIVGFFAGLGDFIVLNPIQFWTEDVWDRRGTAYDYSDSQAEDAVRTKGTIFEKK